MADELVNSSFGLLNKFVKSGQESASKTATSHIRESLAVIGLKKYGILYKSSWKDKPDNYGRQTH